MTTDKHYSSTCCLKVISHYVSAANDRWADRSGTVSVSVARGPELTAVRPAQTFSFSWTPAPCCAAAARHPIARVRLHHPGARVFRRLTLRRDRAPSLRSRPADTAFALRPASRRHSDRASVPLPRHRSRARLSLPAPCTTPPFLRFNRSRARPLRVEARRPERGARRSPETVIQKGIGTMSAFNVPIPRECRRMIRRGALVAINASGGKDSQAMKILLARIVPRDQLLVVHAPSARSSGTTHSRTSRARFRRACRSSWPPSPPERPCSNRSRKEGCGPRNPRGGARRTRSGDPSSASYAAI